MKNIELERNVKFCLAYKWTLLSEHVKGIDQMMSVIWQKRWKSISLCNYKGLTSFPEEMTNLHLGTGIELLRAFQLKCFAILGEISYQPAFPLQESSLPLLQIKHRQAEGNSLKKSFKKCSVYFFVFSPKQTAIYGSWGKSSSMLTNHYATLNQFTNVVTFVSSASSSLSF